MEDYREWDGCAVIGVWAWFGPFLSRIVVDRYQFAKGAFRLRFEHCKRVLQEQNESTVRREPGQVTEAFGECGSVSPEVVRKLQGCGGFVEHRLNCAHLPAAKYPDGQPSRCPVPSSHCHRPFATGKEWEQLTRHRQPIHLFVHQLLLSRKRTQF